EPDDVAGVVDDPDKHVAGIVLGFRGWARCNRRAQEGSGQDTAHGRFSRDGHRHHMYFLQLRPPNRFPSTVICADDAGLELCWQSGSQLLPLLYSIWTI